VNDPAPTGSKATSKAGRTKKERVSMAIYQLDAERPELPTDQRYWVAESL